MTVRNNLYRAARIMGDVDAVRKGRIGQRLANRLMGRVAGRVMGKLWR